MSATVQARVTLAGFAATMLAGLTLKPLVQGLGWYAAIFVVVALTSGVGASMRQVTGDLLLVVGSQVAMLMIALTALFARDAAVWGVLPGPAAVRSITELLGQGLNVTRQEAPPVEATHGVCLLTSGGLGLVGLLVDLIAVTMRRPAAAGLPLLAVYCVPAAVLPGGLPWIYFLLCGAGYLILVGADAADRVRAWGRVLSETPGTPNVGLGGPLSGARGVAAAGLVIAVTTPALIPGLGEPFLGRSGTRLGPGHGTKISVVNPILHLRADLGSRSDEPMIRYTTDADTPQPLRIVTDDQFTGTAWQPSTGSLARSQTVQSGLPNPPGLRPQTSRSTHRARVWVGPMAQTYLPLPYPTTTVSDIRGRWLWDAQTLNVVGEGITTQNLTYTAQYLVLDPTPAQLTAAGEPPADLVKRYAALPPNLPAVITRTARTVAGHGAQYDQAVRLQAWLRTGGKFTYSEKAPGDGRTDSSQDAVAVFLRDRTGYCVQFASAMAVMARALGIPARVAIGFLPGTPTADGTYLVTLQDAHAWPELYFEGTGWTRFEPTPASRTGAPPAWTLPQPVAEPVPGTRTSTDRPLTTQVTPQAQPDLPELTGAAPAGPSGPARWLRMIPWRLLVVVGLLLLLLALPSAATDLMRRHRRRRASTPAARVEAAWEELRLSLQDLGVEWAASWTPRVLHLRLADERGFDPVQRAAMARLVADLERARYAPPGSPVRPPKQLQKDVRIVVAAVAATVSPSTRRRARLLPASGLAALAGLARRVNTAARHTGERTSALRSRLRHVVRTRFRQGPGGDQPTA